MSILFSGAATIGFASSWFYVHNARHAAETCMYPTPADWPAPKARLNRCVVAMLVMNGVMVLVALGAMIPVALHRGSIGAASSFVQALFAFCVLQVLLVFLARKLTHHFVDALKHAPGGTKGGGHFHPEQEMRATFGPGMRKMIKRGNKF